MPDPHVKKENKSARNPLLVLFVGICLVLVPGFLIPAASQEPDIQPGQGPAELSPDAIQERMDEVEASAVFDEEEKQSINSYYEEALGYLETASRERQRIQELQNQINNAPQKREELRRSLSELRNEQERLRERIQENRYRQELNELSFDELTSRLEQVRQRRDEASNTLERLQEEERERSRVTTEIPDRISTREEQREETRQTVQSIEETEEISELEAARRTRAEARIEILDATIERLNTEQERNQVRSDVLTSQIQETSLRLDILSQELQQIESAVQQRRRREAQNQLQQDREALRQARENEAHPLLIQLLEENVTYSEQRTGEDGTTARLERLARERQEVENERDELQREFNQIRERVETVGLNRPIGQLLRMRREDLPTVDEYWQNIQQRSDRIDGTQLMLFDIRDNLSELTNINREVERLLTEWEVPAEERDGLRERVRQMLQTQRDRLETLLEDGDQLVNRMVTLDQVERDLVETISEFRTFINRRVLWIRSAEPFSWEDTRQSLESARELFLSTESLSNALLTLRKDAREHTLLYITVLFLLLLLVAYRGRWRSSISERGEFTYRREGDSFQHTLVVLLETLTLALPIPVMFLFLGWRLRESLEAEVTERALGAGLVTAGAAVLTLTFLYHLCRKNGLGERHFLWNREILTFFRTRLVRAIVPMIFLIFVIGLVEYHPQDYHRNSLGRLAFMLSALPVSGLLASILAPGSGIVRKILSPDRGGTIYKLRYIWYPALVVVPLAMAVLSYLGYHYTAIQISLRAILTIWILVGLLLLVFLGGRLISVTNIYLRMKQREEDRKRREEEREEEQEQTAEVETVEEKGEKKVDYTSLTRQTRQLLWGGFYLLLAIGLLFIWSDMLPALGHLEDVKLWELPTTVIESGNGNGTTTVEAVSVTLLDLLVALLVLSVTIMLARNSRGLLELMILQHLSLAHGLRYATITLFQYIVIMLGIILFATQMGLRWGDIQWLVAAVGVGLGFGLQEIFANFVSGIIILFERPIRVGDTVTVGEVTGTVTRIQMRATTIQDLDRKELVVPNRKFLTEELVNWTLTDPTIRLVVPIGISYDSDVKNAERIMLETAGDNEKVKEDPEPSVIFSEFGDSALQYKLRVFIDNYDNYHPVRHELHREITHRFREEGITIPFPQRDLHVRSDERDIPIRDPDSFPEMDEAITDVPPEKSEEEEEEENDEDGP